MAVFLLSRRWWRGLILLMPFAAFAYPVASVVIGLIAAIYLVMLFFEDRQHAAQLFRCLAIGSAVAIAILAVKYVSPPELVGSMRSQAEILAMPEMVKGGMNNSPYVPIPSLFEELTERLWDPFVLFSAFFYFLVLGRRGIGWERSWTALFLAAVIGYVVADLFFMRFYIPNRYTRYSLAVLVTLWNARNWDLILARVPNRWARILLVGGLIAVGGYTYQDTFRQGKDTSDRAATMSSANLSPRYPRRFSSLGRRVASTTSCCARNARS